MKISAILAVGKEGEIGLNGGLPWQSKGDMQHFKNLTSGHCILMGMNTYNSIGRPLPNRTNIVITRWWKGSSLITTDWKVYHIHSEERKVFDVTWAWDTYIATLTYALGKWMNMTDAVELANKASGIVVWKVGTASITKEELWI